MNGICALASHQWEKIHNDHNSEVFECDRCENVKIKFLRFPPIRSTLEYKQYFKAV